MNRIFQFDMVDFIDQQGGHCSEFPEFTYGNPIADMVQKYTDELQTFQMTPFVNR